MPVKIHEMKTQRASGLLLAGERRGKGLKLSGGMMPKRPRGRPKKNMEGGDIFSGLLKSTLRKIKNDPKGALSDLGRALNPKEKGNIWSGAQTTLTSAEGTALRKKLKTDETVNALASALPYGSDKAKSAYNKNVRDAGISTDFGANIDMAKELDTALRNEVKRITGKDKPDTLGAMATGDLDLMKQKNLEWSNMVKSDPRIKTIIDTEVFKIAVKYNKKPERVGQKLWLDPATLKEYNGDTAVKMRDAWNNSDQVKANPDLMASPNPQKASGLMLAGRGCCKTGRCKMCKLEGGSKQAGYIKKLLKDDEFDINKMIKEPSKSLKKGYKMKRTAKEITKVETKKTKTKKTADNDILSGYDEKEIESILNNNFHNNTGVLYFMVHNREVDDPHKKHTVNNSAFRDLLYAEAGIIKLSLFLKYKDHKDIYLSDDKVKEYERALPVLKWEAKKQRDIIDDELKKGIQGRPFYNRKKENTFYNHLSHNTWGSGSGIKLSGSGKASKWIEYVKKCQKENGNCSYKEALQRAKQTYK